MLLTPVNSVTVLDSGVYLATYNVSGLFSAAGTVTVSLQDDGVSSSMLTQTIAVPADGIAPNRFLGSSTISIEANSVIRLAMQSNVANTFTPSAGIGASFTLVRIF